MSGAVQPDRPNRLAHREVGTKARTKTLASRTNQESLMKPVVAIIALALTSTALNVAPAAAQYDSPAPAPQQPYQTPPRNAEPAAPKLNISKAARKPILELQAAVQANDVANIPAKLAAARAAAQSVDEKYMVASLQFKAAAAANDDAAMAAGVEALLASGGVSAANSAPMHFQLGKHDYKAKRYDKAAA